MRKNQILKGNKNNMIQGSTFDTSIPDILKVEDFELPSQQAVNQSSHNLIQSAHT
jgi:hypothetical protein